MLDIVEETGNFWLLKNRMGATGYVPYNTVEVVLKRKSAPKGDDDDLLDQINLSCQLNIDI